MIESNGKTVLQKVEENVGAYARILLELLGAYKLYDESVDVIVDVWKEMLSSSEELKKTFYLLIMKQFVEIIWDDENIKMLMQEIVQHQEKFKDHQTELNQLLEIDARLQEVKKKYGGNKTENKPDSEPCSSCDDSEDTDHSDCQKCNNSGGSKKKKAKAKEIKPVK